MSIVLANFESFYLLNYVEINNVNSFISMGPPLLLAPMPFQIKPHTTIACPMSLDPVVVKSGTMDACVTHGCCCTENSDTRPEPSLLNIIYLLLVKTFKMIRQF